MCEFIIGKNCILVLTGKNDIIMYIVYIDLFYRILYFFIILLLEDSDLLLMVELVEEIGESGFGKIELVEKVILV